MSLCRPGDLAYYNEFDPYAAQWLRNLITGGHIAPGYVDERSILDVKPQDLTGFKQHHFFAGLGGWSVALRRARWPDHRPVCTMSCPCQPFSAAGQGNGFDDERHLWPAAYYLLGQFLPADVFGEQVASKDADAWVDLVHADMEALGYAFGCVPFPAAGIGSPHIRDRNYWMAHSSLQRLEAGHAGGFEDGQRLDTVNSSCSCLPDRMDNSDNTRLEGLRGGHSAACGREGAFRPIAAPSEFSGLAHAHGGYAGTERQQPGGQYGQQQEDDSALRLVEPGSGELGVGGRPGPTNGHWRDADWLYCRDGKWRPVEPGTFPLAHGAKSRVGRLRAYGNAINIEAATAFIESTY